MSSATQTFGSTLSLSCQRVMSGNCALTITSMLVVAIIVAASLFYVWSRLQVLRTGYAISGQTQALQQLRAENEQLRGEVARLKSPERIERIAREKLGLIFPRPEQVRIIVEKPGG